MANAQQGDKEAFKTLLLEVRPPIARFLQRRIPDQQEVEDACQETMIAIFESRRSYDISRPFEPWLYAIARNVGANHARKHWSRNWQELRDQPPEAIVSDDAGAHLKIEQALSRLPALQMEALRMTKIEGLSLDEAAARAGATVGAMKVRVHRAFDSIRRLLLE